MSGHRSDPFAAAVKAALEPSFGPVGTPSSDGVVAAVTEGSRLRRLRHLRQAVAAGVVVAVLAVALGWAWQVVASDDGGEGSASSGTGAAGGRPPAAGASAPGDGSTTSTAPSSSTTSVPEPTTGSAAGPEIVVPSSPAPVEPVSTPSGPPSTSTTSTSTSTTTPPAPSLELLVSTSDDRSAPSPLDGASVSGVVYVFYDHVAFPIGGPAVSFWIDDPARAGPADRVESSVPYDLAATAPGGEAYGYDTAALGAGTHTLTASAAPAHVVTVSFTVV